MASGPQSHFWPEMVKKSIPVTSTSIAPADCAPSTRIGTPLRSRSSRTGRTAPVVHSTWDVAIEARARCHRREDPVRVGLDHHHPGAGRRDRAEQAEVLVGRGHDLVVRVEIETREDDVAALRRRRRQRDGARLRSHERREAAAELFAAVEDLEEVRQAGAALGEITLGRLAHRGDGRLVPAGRTCPRSGTRPARAPGIGRAPRRMSISSIAARTAPFCPSGATADGVSSLGAGCACCSPTRLPTRRRTTTALARALAAAGADVELLTSRFRFGATPAADGVSRPGELLPGLVEGRLPPAASRPQGARAPGRPGPAGRGASRRDPSAVVRRTRARRVAAAVAGAARLHRARPAAAPDGAQGAPLAAPLRPLRAHRGALGRAAATRSPRSASTRLGSGSIPHPVFRSDPGRHDDGHTVLVLGVLRPYKGLDDAVTATLGVDGARLLVAGDPRIPLDDLRRRAGGRAEWRLGYLSRAELERALGEATVAVFPYRAELDQSGALLQALGAGIPAVVYDVGGLGEVVTQYAAGSVVPAGDVEATGCRPATAPRRPGRPRRGPCRRRARAVRADLGGGGRRAPRRLPGADLMRLRRRPLRRCRRTSARPARRRRGRAARGSGRGRGCLEPRRPGRCRGGLRRLPARRRRHRRPADRDPRHLRRDAGRVRRRRVPRLVQPVGVTPLPPPRDDRHRPPGRIASRACSTLGQLGL